MSILSSILGLDSAKSERERISLDDIEGRFREMTGAAQGAVAASGSTAIAAGAAGALALAAVFYVFGRRRGRKRASVLEIRRI